MADAAEPLPGTAVLVVDDEPAMTTALGAALAARGYRVLSAATGAAALTLLARDHPSVVVLDLGLPDVDGISLCRRIRKSSEVPILVLSADGADDRKARALDEGADDYVTKPFSMPELMARVRVAIRHGARTDGGDSGVLEVGEVRIDLATRVG